VSPKVGKFSEQVWGNSGERQHHLWHNLAEAVERAVGRHLSGDT